MVLSGGSFEHYSEMTTSGVIAIIFSFIHYLRGGEPPLMKFDKRASANW
jgi:hypothetical protein